jgi:putative transposase
MRAMDRPQRTKRASEAIPLERGVEQDHRAVKRVTRPMLGFKSFDAAQGTLAGIELMHMIKKRQMIIEARDEGLTAAEQFYSLAA